jgi:hypothetical protein
MDHILNKEHIMGDRFVAFFDILDLQKI